MATDNLAQPSTSTTRRRMHGKRWETYLLIEKIVCAICYRTERSLLLEEQIVMASSLAEWTWHSCLFTDSDGGRVLQWGFGEGASLWGGLPQFV